MLKKTNKVMSGKQQRQADNIRDCLDDITFGCLETVALPGFGEGDVCLLCKLQMPDVINGKKVEERGATLAEFLCQSEWQFNNAKGTPLMTVATEVHSALVLFIESDIERLGFLKDVTPQQVYNHFAHDHRGKQSPKVKEKVERVLLSLLNVGIQSCCQKLENGRTVLIKDEASVILQIVDRLTKLGSLTK